MYTLLAKIFGYFVKRRNTAFDKGTDKIYLSNVPVISIGNISMGGTGKTPFAIMLAKMITDFGFKTAIIGRGYKRKSKGELIVCDGNKILTDPEFAGDEMFLVADILNSRFNLNIPVVVHDKKFLAAKSINEHFDVDVIIVDDGFQHRQLHRDLDIVLLDKRTLERPYLFPKGMLRETPDSLKRADFICLTDAQADYEIPHGHKAGLIRTEVFNGNIYCLQSGEEAAEPELEKLKENCVAVSGIGSPEKFESSLKAISVNFVKHIRFSDHYRYFEQDVKRIIKICRENSVKYLITTEKDAAKLNKFGSFFAKEGIECCVLPIEMAICEGREVFENKLLSVIKSTARAEANRP